MTSTREGDFKGTTIKGGLEWPVQQRATFIPQKHRFPTIPPSDGEKEKKAQVVRPEGNKTQIHYPFHKRVKQREKALLAISVNKKKISVYLSLMASTIVVADGKYSCRCSDDNRNE
jgi:hypothetical protein